MSYDDFRVTGHIEPVQQDPWHIETFDVTRDAASLAFFTQRYRGGEGTFTRLSRNRGLWMSDTRDEYIDHWAPINQAHGRVLINGLGLGCVLKAVLAKPAVEHVDVVEIDTDLVMLMRRVAPWVNDERVTIHSADAYVQAKFWPPGTRWDVAWHDIWKDITTEDLDGHARLLRSYGRRVGWQGAWKHDELLARKRQERESVWF